MMAPHPTDETRTGSSFYTIAAAMGWQQRDSLAVDWLSKGYYPNRLTKFVPIRLEGTDSSGNKLSIIFYATKDYLSVGSDADWARVCITPMAAAAIAGKWNCALPTTAMVDAIYAQATVKLTPVPMYAFRDSTPTMWHHHLIIEGQRKRREGMIAGIKKDVVQTPQLQLPNKQNKVAIYGWHKEDGKPIQPLYTGHVNWYVDYSHGIRMVSKTLSVNGKPILLTDALRNNKLHAALCNENGCNALQH